MRTHGPALVISALVHLGLLALFMAGVAQLPSDTQKETRLAVNLQMFQPPPPSLPEPEPEPEAEPEPEPTPPVEPEPIPAPAPVMEPPPEPVPAKVEPQPRPKPAPKPKPKPAPPPEPLPVTKPVEPVLTPPPVPQPVVQSAPVEPAVDSGLIRRIEEEYKASLRQAIEANKGYPRRAVRLRQEGEVVVGFTILRSGAIEGLRIVESSGSALLDKAALGAVEKTSGQLPFPEALTREQWAFTIPINYALR
jgi:protein TonB